jgi:hypothetical protein
LCHLLGKSPGKDLCFNYWKNNLIISFIIIIVIFKAELFTHIVVEFKHDNESTSHFQEKSYSLSTIQHDRGSSRSEMKKIQRILYWTEYFGMKNYEFKLGNKVFKDAGCQVTNCLLTNDRSLLNSSDAVIFHINDFDDRDLPNPRHRLPHQRFIFYNLRRWLGSKIIPCLIKLKTISIGL